MQRRDVRFCAIGMIDMIRWLGRLWIDIIGRLHLGLVGDQVRRARSRVQIGIACADKEHGYLPGDRSYAIGVIVSGKRREWCRRLNNRFLSRDWFWAGVSGIKRSQLLCQ